MGDFQKIFSEDDVIQFVSELMTVTNGISNDSIFLKSEQFLLEAATGFLRYEVDYDDHKINILQDMLNSNSTDLSDKRHFMELVFEEFTDEYNNQTAYMDEKEKPILPFYVKKYIQYKMLAGNKANAVMVSCQERLNQLSDEVSSNLATDDFKELLNG
jgi:hypothetical protein